MNIFIDPSTVDVQDVKAVNALSTLLVKVGDDSLAIAARISGSTRCKQSD